MALKIYNRRRQQDAFTANLKAPKFFVFGYLRCRRSDRQELQGTVLPRRHMQLDVGLVVE